MKTTPLACLVFALCCAIAASQTCDQYFDTLAILDGQGVTIAPYLTVPSGSTGSVSIQVTPTDTLGSDFHVYILSETEYNRYIDGLAANCRNTACCGDVCGSTGTYDVEATMLGSGRYYTVIRCVDGTSAECDLNYQYAICYTVTSSPSPSSSPSPVSPPPSTPRTNPTPSGTPASSGSYLGKRILFSFTWLMTTGDGLWAGTYTIEPGCDTSTCCCLTGEIYVAQQLNSQTVQITGSLTGQCPGGVTLFNPTLTLDSGSSTVAEFKFGTNSFRATKTGKQVQMDNLSASQCSGSGTCVSGSCLTSGGSVSLVSSIVTLSAMALCLI